MRQAVIALAELGQMPDERAAPETVQAYEQLVQELDPPASNEEARVLLDVLPRDDSTLFGLAWSVLHLIETAPGWPDVDALDDRGWWVKILRERAQRGGLLPRS
jgi:hypothetical protein